MGTGDGFNLQGFKNQSTDRPQVEAFFRMNAPIDHCRITKFHARLYHRVNVSQQRPGRVRKAYIHCMFYVLHVVVLQVGLIEYGRNGYEKVE